MFQSSSVLMHLFRGILGFGLLALSIYLFIQGLLLSVIFGIFSAICGFVVLRGCPVCWIIGLILTISNSDKTCESCDQKNK